MWKNQIKTITSLNDGSVENYCDDFLKIFQLKTYSCEEICNYFESQENQLDFFIEQKKYNEIFTNKKLEILIGILKNISNKNIQKKLPFSILPKFTNTDEIVKNYFELFFLYADSFDLEDILKAKENVLFYLFLFYLPHNKKSLLLFHQQKQIPLVSCVGISKDNMKMLMFLMKKYEKISFKNWCEQLCNLNFYLINDYLKTKVYEDISLPIEKIKYFLKHHCGFQGLYKIETPVLNQLYEIEFEYKKRQFDKKLPYKIKNKTIKI